MLPLTTNQTIVYDNFIDNNTYITGNGKAITHLVNGQAGNIVSPFYISVVSWRRVSFPSTFQLGPVDEPLFIPYFYHSLVWIRSVTLGFLAD